MFGFIVKWIGVSVMVVLMSSCVGTVSTSMGHSHFVLGGHNISWALVAGLLTFYYGLKLSVKSGGKH